MTSSSICHLQSPLLQCCANALLFRQRISAASFADVMYGTAAALIAVCESVNGMRKQRVVAEHEGVEDTLACFQKCAKSSSFLVFTLVPRGSTSSLWFFSAF